MRFVDSNVFVYHLSSDPAYGERAASILKRVENGEECVTSTLVISQVCGYMKWRKKAEAIPRFIGLLRALPSMTKMETTFADFARAAERHTDLSFMETLRKRARVAREWRRYAPRRTSCPGPEARPAAT